ncbi:Acetyltransferase involved in cellulose biosynthesis, CelD/BcsL family [Thermomonospora echinospora]|uniref:Acetyltransferase involved in cellulose biosynthesis, CelD/BcsL family n=1 Tax=Thermomonospora echinospora TaxID=1992 RepID=A0A1H5V127_9ACTN|nr:GNAT family N-acetyltransferase [Thermomonospora echinospora]SEF80177.1 Acetyltransferase involved in cellulose biosynthesis, CelD/BcsL family [Thermomonospora echinospora]
MHITVIRPHELGNTELAAWRAMQAARPRLANPFMSPGWALAVDRVLGGGARRGARVAVLEDGPDLVGFFPFELTGRGTGMAIGGWLSLGQGIVHAPDLDRLDARELLRGCGLGVWEYGTLVEGQPWFEPCTTKTLSTVIMDLSGGFDGYGKTLKERGSKLLAKTRTKERKLGREVGEVTFDFDVRGTAALDLVRQWKSQQYQAMGRADRFARPWVVELTDLLHGVHEDDFGGCLSMLYVGGKPVAGHFGLRSRHTLSAWFPVYDPEYARYSPGIILHLHMAEEAAKAGIQELDLGPSAGWPYKRELRSHEILVGEGVVRRPSLSAAAHWARHAPVARARRVVLENKRLYGLADRAMRRYGSYRTRSR